MKAFSTNRNSWDTLDKAASLDALKGSGCGVSDGDCPLTLEAHYEIREAKSLIRLAETETTRSTANCSHILNISSPTIGGNRDRLRGD